ncbi:hypothetical protein KKC1_04190 [Calderihabitans maritimus]|uniref:Uncharacterized protein n=1 Tax=Calderihabitans maritimus TaxID=1246530 RepID=A0A1Z5HPF1_9FIRM|nr:hypothetical protein KKC1_04190 [Calderihabitans maritimus]
MPRKPVSDLNTIFGYGRLQVEGGGIKGQVVLLEIIMTWILQSEIPEEERRGWDGKSCC